MDHSSENHGISNDKCQHDAAHTETVTPTVSNLNYGDEEEEPELHARTYFALAAMFLLNLVQVLALQGPPAVVCQRLVLILPSPHRLDRLTSGFALPCPS
jgi:hypothetical protein